MQIENIIWDWNGTIVDDVPLALDIVNRMLTKRGKRVITLEHYRDIYTHPIQKIYERAGFNFALEPFEELTHEWHNTYFAEIDSIPLFFDSLTILKAFQAKNINQTILSALPHDILTHSIGRHLVSDYFSYYQGLDNRLSKSKIENGQILMKNLGLREDETIIIGDSKHDLETADALGLRCLLVARGFESKERLLAYGCDVFDNFSELLGQI